MLDTGGAAAVRLDPANACLWRGTEALRLTPKAWAVVAVLVAQAGQLVTKEALFATVWPEAVVSEAALVVCIREIRQALGDAARTPQYLETVHRRGYRFIGPLARAGGGAAPAGGDPAGVPGAALGREAELRTLHGWLAQAQGGTRCVGFVTGETGIGKTTLVDTFVAQVAAAGALWVGRGQCVDQYGPGEAYLPVLEALGQLCRGSEAAQVLALLEQHAPLCLVQLPAVLRPPAREALHRQVQGAAPERMLREWAEVVEALTAVRPLVLVLEDLHWSDQATLALVAYLAQRRAPARLLLLGTYRPVDVIVHGHPLQKVKTTLALHGHCVDLPLEVLPAAAVAAIVAARLPGHALAPAVVETLYRRTDGHPLFLVQLMDALLRQGVLVEEAGHWVLTGRLAALEAIIPESLRALIEQQFDGLSAEVQQGLEAASVAGMDWTVAAVAAGVAADAEQVEGWCVALARQGQFMQAGALVAWPDGTVGGSYQFRHALYQQVIYDRIAVGRRVRLHQRIGLRVEAGYGARAQEVATELAVHFERGHDPARAVRYRQQAAAQALERYAYPEAIGHLTRGLALLQTLPETPERTRHALALQQALAPALLARHGATAPVVEHAYGRLRELCEHVGKPAQLGAALLGLGGCHIVRGRLQTARELLQQVLRCAPEAPTTADHGEAHMLLGSIAFFLGAFATARAHLEQSLALYATPSYFRGSASRSFRLIRLAEVLWHLGYPDQAQHCHVEALGLAHAVARPVETAVTLIFAARLHRYRREPQHTLACAEHALALYQAQDPAPRLPPARSPQVGRAFGAFTAQDPTLRLTQARILQGWARVLCGQGEAGLGQLHDGITAYRTHGATVSVAHYLVLLAEAYGYLGDAATGLQVLAEARAVLATSEERYQEAEVYRLQGDLVWQTAPGRSEATGVSRPSFRYQAPLDTAVACCRQALALARQQGAKSLELRAALRLSRLWQQQGKRAEAHALLAPIYGWFTEGFDTADLQDAKALLEECAR